MNLLPKQSRFHKLVLLGAAAAWLCLAQHGLAQHASPRLTIFLSDTGRSSVIDRKEMQHVLKRIFRHAGIETAWGNCLHSACPDTSSSSVMGVPVIVLRIVDHLDRGAPTTAGWTMRGSFVVTVQYTRAHQAAEIDASSIRCGQILGAVAAHEIGHVLLPFEAHSQFGVMKATLGHDDWLRLLQDNLFFTSQQSQQLRARLLLPIPNSETSQASLEQPRAY